LSAHRVIRKSIRGFSLHPTFRWQASRLILRQAVRQAAGAVVVALAR
jgi:hypothetical protein